MLLTDRAKPVTEIARYFTTAHLPPQVRAVSQPVCDLAEQMVSHLPDSPELTAGLRRLLEAKDCFVRCALDLGTAGAELLTQA